MVPFFRGNICHVVYELLVPLSERQHSFCVHGIPEVVAALRFYLERQAETRENVEKAETVYRTLFRLTNEKPGRPRYPEFSWDYAQKSISIYN